MVSWVWIPVTLLFGVVCGMFVIAFAEVSREEERREERKKWWNE